MLTRLTTFLAIVPVLALSACHIEACGYDKDGDRKWGSCGCSEDDNNSGTNVPSADAIGDGGQGSSDATTSSGGEDAGTLSGTDAASSGTSTDTTTGGGTDVTYNPGVYGCKTNVDCAWTEDCVQAYCRVRCKAACDCHTAEACVAGYCDVPAKPTTTCASDCECTVGMTCVNGLCK